MNACASEVQLCQIGSNCIKYENFTKIINLEKVSYYHQSLHSMVKNQIESRILLFEEKAHNEISHIEIIIYSDHSKGSFVVTMTIII